MVLAPALPETVTPAPQAAPRRVTTWPRDVLAALVCLGLGAWVTSRIWADPFRHGIGHNEGDHAFFEWLLGYGPQILRHGLDPYYATLMNAPDGVNLAANTSITVYAVLFAPLTILAGPAVTYVTILTLNLGGSAFAWYLLLRRGLVTHRGAALLGALVCGFTPGWISHANGHLNWTAGWLAPAVFWCVLRLRTTRRPFLDGIVLGLLMAVGFSIAAEMLVSIALVAVILVLVWTLSRENWREALRAAPRALGAVAVGAGVALTVLAYPLYMHFAGIGSFLGTGYNQRNYVEDLGGYLMWPEQSLAGALGLDRGDLASNATEGASFLGIPLLLLTVAAVFLLRHRAARSRRVILRALVLIGLFFLLLSLGPRLNWFGTEHHDIPLLYAPLVHWPIFDAALPARFALVVGCVAGILLALLADNLAARGLRWWARGAWAVAFAAALLPIFPTPVTVTERLAEPAFLADGTWRNYVADGQVMSAVPFASAAVPDGQRWQASTMARGGDQYRIPGGYFLGPGGPDGTGRAGAIPRYTDWLFRRATNEGIVADMRNGQRDRVRADLAHWGVHALYVPEQIIGRNGPLFRAPLVETMTDLFGPPEQVQDVLVWRIRPGIDPVAVPGD